jgi:cytosine/adenosine deaminase-related metal-dependent hydrolase
MRVESMQAFRDLRLERFVDRLVAHVEERYPEKVEGLDPGELRAQAARLCHRSRRWGLTSEAHVTAYVDLSFEWSEGFEDDPGRRDVRAVLRDGSLGPDEKLRRARAILNRFEGEDPFEEGDEAFADPGPPPFVLPE